MSSTSSPHPDDPDTTGSTVPPYDGRQEVSEVDGPEKSTKEGVKTGGATGLVEDDETKAPAPEDTERGAVASPSDEQPASDMPETDLDPDMVPPAHHEGTQRGEDVP